MAFILVLALLGGAVWLWERRPELKARKEKERAEREAKRRGIHRRGAKIVSANDLQKMIDEKEKK